MMMGKRISAALAAIVAACALTGVSSTQAQSVVVYNAVSPKVMTAFVEAFQKQNPGIRVDVIAGGSGELLTRLQAEKANPRADLLVGPDIDVFDAAIDLFEGYKSIEDAAFPRTAPAVRTQKSRSPRPPRWCRRARTPATSRRSPGRSRRGP